MSGSREVATGSRSPSSVASPFGSSDAAKQRSSSTASSDAAESGAAPVMPLAASSSFSQAPQVPRLELEKLGASSAAATDASPPPAKAPPQSAVYNTFSFEEVMSPRTQNGKRYLGGYLQHRASMAGGFLKTWKRKYFRLRDHGIVCYKNAEDALPLFEVAFKAHSLLLLGKQHVEGTASSPSSAHAQSADKLALGPAVEEAPKPKAGGPLLFILKHVEVVGHQTPANKVDVPLYLKADSLADYAAWIDSLRLKMEARKRALAQSSVHAVASGPSNSRKESYVDDRSTRVGSERGAVDAASGTTDGAVQKKSGGAAAPAASENKAPESHPLEEEAPKRQPPQALDPPEYALFQNKYLILREVGEGSFSIVHKAVNRVTGCLCAVKCCKASAALDEEVGIMRTLAHPNVVGVEAVYSQDSMCFVVMDLMEDGDLCDRLIERQRLPEREAQVVVAQVLQGLAYLHRHHILHRDVKPENILLHGDAVKIADFGLAKQLPSATAMLKRSCGTLEYAAPELLVGQPYGLKSDVFSLGVVLYVLLFGAFPFSIESAAALQRMEQFPDGVDVRDMRCLDPANVQWRSVSREAQDVLLQMLAPREQDRVSAEALLAHPWFDPARTAPLGAAARSLRRGSDTWKTLEQNAVGYERVRLADCEARGFRELLACGLELTKYSARGSAAPHASSISIDFAQLALQWTARHSALGSATDAKKPKRGRSIRLRDVLEIRLGHATETFAQRAKDPPLPPPDVCLSVVCAWRTLDLVVKAPRQREFLVKGLTLLIESAGGGSGALKEEQQPIGKSAREHVRV